MNDVTGHNLVAGSGWVLDRDPSAVSPTRDALMRKGIIHAPHHGLIAFSIPGFRDYLVEQALDET